MDAEKTGYGALDLWAGLILLEGVNSAPRATKEPLVPLPNWADANSSPLWPRITRKDSASAITLGSKSMLGVKGFTAASNAING